MLNPNICKRITVDVLPFPAHSCMQLAMYRGNAIAIHDMQPKQPGRRRMYLRYSIFLDRYYLRSK